MRCIVTAGPTCEPIDQVRRLTNSSTGSLGTALADFLAARGFEVVLLRGTSATAQWPRQDVEVVSFTTTSELLTQLTEQRQQPVHAVFHAAAVCDYAPGRVLVRRGDETFPEIQAGKVPTGQGNLWLELVPTPKIIAHLEELFPTSRNFGWKLEVDGDRDRAIRAAREQIQRHRLAGSIVNGPAYGSGYGLVLPAGSTIHASGPEPLFEYLHEQIQI